MFSLVLFVAAIEGGHALVRNVELFQPEGPLLRTARMLYLERRNTIQFFPECARFDPDVSYVLRPGTCRFSNDEFSTAYRINGAGLRDDEESLRQPELIVLGDSYAMGWGVEQDETVAAVLETTTGLKVLNAAISSYGTVRELRMLERLDTSRMRYLVIQYSGNDDRENAEYLDNGNRLETMNEEAYDALVRRHAERRRYYPGAYVRTHFDAVRSGMVVGRPGARGQASSPRIEGDLRPSMEREVHAFLNALSNIGVDLTGVRVVVVAIATDVQFVEGLRRALESGALRNVAGSVVASDLAFLLTETDYYRLDDHWRASGHARVAAHVRELSDLSSAELPRSR